MTAVTASANFACLFATTGDKIVRRAILISIMTVLSASAPSWAAGPASGSHEYKIDHYALGDIGNHVYTFTREGKNLIVTAKIRLRAKVLFVTIRRYTADRREVWRGGRLIAYQSRTNDDGKIIEVTALAEGDKLIIDGPKGRVEAPGDIRLTSAWSVDFLKGDKMMDTETGEIRSITVTDMGFETVDIGGKQIKARKFHIGGDLDRDYWYGEDGTWVKLRLTRDGDVIYVTMKQPRK